MRAFILGISIILIALVVPMDSFVMYSMFTVHVIQHLLLSLATPPLVLLSIPPLRERTHLDRHTLFLGGHVPVFHADLYAFFTYDGYALERPASASFLCVSAVEKEQSCIQYASSHRGKARR